MKLREDEFVYPLMVDLVACLCTEIAESGLPEPCQCSLVPGADIVLDYCGSCDDAGCGGQAWVRLAGAYPSSLFPSLDEIGATCHSPIAYQVEIGIARCAPVGSTSMVNAYTPPTLEQQLDAVRIQSADMSAMRRAIACCLTQNHEDLTYTMGAYTPLSGGDCNGGTWLVTVWSA